MFAYICRVKGRAAFSSRGQKRRNFGKVERAGCGGGGSLSVAARSEEGPQPDRLPPSPRPLHCAHKATVSSPQCCTQLSAAQMVKKTLAV